jgi:hypothetical protein
MPRVEDELRDVWNTWIEDEDFGLVGALPAAGVAAIAATAARAVGGNSSPPSNDVNVNPCEAHTGIGCQRNFFSNNSQV